MQADVTITVGNDGVIRVSGYSVIQKDGSELWAAPRRPEGHDCILPCASTDGKNRTARIGSCVLRVSASDWGVEPDGRSVP
jgi:hypothetical protein